VIAEVLKGNAGLAHILTDMFNVFLVSGTPQQWNEIYLTSLYKGSGDRQDPGNYRGVAIASCVAKVYARLLADRLTKVANDNKLRAKGYTCQKRAIVCGIRRFAQSF
jgi:hypothetical protein